MGFASNLVCEEPMARAIRDVVALLNRLIHAEYCAVDAYKAVMNGLGDSADVVQLGAFLADHRRHVEQLAFIVRNLGGEPACRGDLRHALSPGARVKVDLTRLTEARALVEALHGGEADTQARYEDAVSQPGIPIDVVAVLERSLEDERRHHPWLGNWVHVRA
jgi:Domain of unknown function (DUF2383)